MKTLLTTIANSIKNFLTYELKGFAGEAAGGTKASGTNVTEYMHIGSSHQYDQVGGKDSENNTPPPKGLILLPFLFQGQGYDPGDTAPTLSVTLNYSDANVNDELTFTTQNSDYRGLYDQALQENLIVLENEEGEGEFFTIANPDGLGFITRIFCDSENELIQVNHTLVDALNQTGCMMLINKSI